MAKTVRRVKRCPVCGTHTGTHWYDYCPPTEYEDVEVGTTTGRMSCSNSNNRQPITARTPGEKEAYRQGYEACLKQVKKGLDPHGRQWDLAQLRHNVDVAQAAADLIKETL